MIKILVADGIDKEGLDILAGNGGFQLIFVKDQQQLMKEIEEAQALLVRSKTKVTSQLLDSGKKLKFVGRAGVGIDNIDVNYASQKGVMVVNVPGGNTISAAEHTFALILSLARNIPQAQSSMKSGLWEREKFTGSELQGKVLGLIGFGRIGKEVAKRALTFGMKVCAYDPFVSEEHMKDFGVISASIDAILKGSDFVSLHIPTTDQTKKLINEDALSKMKPDSKLINCARGELVDEAALVRALKDGKIKGAALDVFSQEPPKNPDLLALNNLILTPHLGASTEEAQIKVAVDLAVSVKDYFEKGLVRNAVNLPNIDAETLEKCAPYISLSEKLGMFVSQIVTGGVREIKTEFFGGFTSEMRRLLSLSVIKGALSTAMGEDKINRVNALPIAKERGIRFEETAISGSEDFTTLINVKIITDKQTKSASGTIFSSGKPRIVRIDGLPVDIVPEGHMIVFTNIDKPGVVGFIGTLLGQNNINIAAFQVGRKAVGGEAVSILNVDSPVPDQVLSKIRGFEGITNLWLVNCR